MNYYIDAENINLDALRKRIEEIDLVPSRRSLLENIDTNFSKLKEDGYATMADLRKALKNSKNIPSVSKSTGIDTQYLTLLRREIESYFPKAFPVKAFDWLPKKDISALEKQEYKNTVLLFKVLYSSKQSKEIFSDLGIDSKTIEELSCLVNLTRIQWVSPLAAKMLFDTGYNDAKSVAKADAEKLCSELDSVNKANNYFKGTIGLRDIKRLIKAASYVA